MLLMCKNVPVFDLETSTILNESLLPGLLKVSPDLATFKVWMGTRRAERSNDYANQIKQRFLPNLTDTQIDNATGAFPLSDCYWLRDPRSSDTFESRSPYHVDFCTIESENYQKGLSSPTSYVDGVLPKLWVTSDYLFKRGCEHEIRCVEFVRDLGLSTVSISKHAIGNADGILIENFTSTSLFFESVRASGRIMESNYTTSDLLELFDESAFDMLFVDALLGNGDRHLGNFGFLRDANTGAYVSMAPLFDFDHAFESHNHNDVLIREIRDLRHHFPKRFQELVNRTWRASLSPYILERLSSICF